MNREIKFRGKRIGNGKWIYGSLIQFNGCVEICDCNTVDNSRYEVDPETVGQLTGLKDKNVKEIYEGDILREHSIHPDEKPRVIQIIWKDGGFMYRNIYNSDFYTYQSHCSMCEIIGNIFENPELAKEV